MFGIVTVLGLDHPFVGAGDTPPPPPDPTTPTNPASPPIQVVIHRTPATAPATTPAAEATTTTPDRGER